VKVRLKYLSKQINQQTNNAIPRNDTAAPLHFRLQWVQIHTSLIIAPHKMKIQYQTQDTI